MKSFPVWRFSKLSIYALGGLLALGGFYDALANAQAIVTPIVTYISTAIFFVLMVLEKFLLPKYPISWPLGNGQSTQIRRIGIRPKLFLLGALLLNWFPRVWPSSSENPPERRELPQALMEIAGKLAKTDRTLETLILDAPQKHGFLLMGSERTCTDYLRVDFNPRPMNDLFGNFILEPYIKPMRVQAFEDNQKVTICVDFSPDNLISYFDGLPDEALFAGKVMPYQERHLAWECSKAQHEESRHLSDAGSSSCPFPPDIVIFPNGARRIADNSFAWTPNTHQAGTRQYFILIYAQPRVLDLHFRNIDPQKPTTVSGIAKMRLPISAAVYRYNVESTENITTVKFERFENEKSIFMTTEVVIRVRNLSKVNVMLNGVSINPDDIQRDLYSFLDNLTDDSLRTITVEAGREMRFGRLPDKQSIIYFPKGATFDGKEMRWKPAENQIGLQSYIIINRPDRVIWQHCETADRKQCKRIAAGSGMPAVFAAIRIKVMKSTRRSVAIKNVLN